MGNKIIYEKNYPKERNLFQEVRDDTLPLLEDAEAIHSLFALMREDYQKLVYILRTDRVDGQAVFVATAVALSKKHRIDLLITEHADCICAAFTGRYSLNLPDIKELVRLADDITFACGPDDNEVRILLEYYTHSVYQNGQKIR